MRRLQEKDPTLVQVLSLYLLLLAFFVVLFNASRLDKARVAAVGESVSSAFRQTDGIPGPARRNVSQEGGALAPSFDFESLAELVRTELKVAEIRVVRAGRLMQARLPADALFAAGERDVRLDKRPFVSTLSSLLGEKPTGRRHKVEIFVGSDPITPDRMRETVPIEIDRASEIAATMLAQGALPGTVMSGVDFAAPGEVVLLFRIDPDIRPEDTKPADKPSAGTARGKTVRP